MKKPPTLSLLLAAFLFSLGARAKVIEIPAEQIRSPSDVKNLLGKPPPAEEAPLGFEWRNYGGPINVSTNVLFPLEGAAVEPSFEVPDKP